MGRNGVDDGIREQVMIIKVIGVDDGIREQVMIIKVIGVDDYQGDKGG